MAVGEECTWSFRQCQALGATQVPAPSIQEFLLSTYSMPSRLIEPGAPAGDTLANFPVLSAQSFEKGHTQHSHRCQEGGNDHRLLHHKSARGFYSGWSGSSSWKKIIWVKAEVIKWRQSR